jgi:hypothetical protein
MLRQLDSVFYCLPAAAQELLHYILLTLAMQPPPLAPPAALQQAPSTGLTQQVCVPLSWSCSHPVLPEKTPACFPASSCMHCVLLMHRKHSRMDMLLGAAAKRTCGWLCPCTRQKYQHLTTF